MDWVLAPDCTAASQCHSVVGDVSVPAACKYIMPLVQSVRLISATLTHFIAACCRSHDDTGSSDKLVQSI